MSELCIICCEERKKLIECSECKTRACAKCYEHMFSDQHIPAMCEMMKQGENDKMVKCEKEWCAQTLHDLLGAGKAKRLLRKRRENKAEVMWSGMVRERHTELDAEIQVSMWKRRLKTERKELEKERLRLRIKQCEWQIEQIDAGKDTQLDETMDFVRKYNFLDSILNRKPKLKDAVYAYLGISQGKEKKKNSSKIYACPNEECNSFISLTSKRQYKCASCDSSSCGLCETLIGEDEKHECDKDTRATIRDIRNSTVPCPKCHTRIHRSYGCNQMFCTQCRVFFDYSTDKQITSGALHNPEYARLLDDLKQEGKTITREEMGIDTDATPQYNNAPCGFANRMDEIRRSISSFSKKSPTRRIVEAYLVCVGDFIDGNHSRAYCKNDDPFTKVRRCYLNQDTKAKLISNLVSIQAKEDAIDIFGQIKNTYIDIVLYFLHKITHDKKLTTRRTELLFEELEKQIRTCVVKMYNRFHLLFRPRLAYFHFPIHTMEWQREDRIGGYFTLHKNPQV